MTEPCTTDQRISFFDRRGGHQVFDRPARCALCNSCLLERSILYCRDGGPFVHPDEKWRFEITYFDSVTNRRMLFQRTNDPELAKAWAEVIDKDPKMQFARIHDLSASSA